MRWLQFYAGEFDYLLPLRDIEQVIPFVPVRRVQNVPEYCLGVLDFHGREIPVVDLSLVLAGVLSRPLLSTRVIVVPFGAVSGSGLLGLVAERATRVLDRPDCVPPPRRLTDLHGRLPRDVDRVLALVR